MKSMYSVGNSVISIGKFLKLPELVQVTVVIGHTYLPGITSSLIQSPLWVLAILDIMVPDLFWLWS